MRKKTRRFIGALLAMVLAFSSIGEAVPAFAADELILSDEIGEDILLTDEESPDEETADFSAAPDADVSAEDGTGTADGDAHINEDIASFDEADILADTDAGITADGDTQNTQDGKEPNPIADHYDIDGVCYYNVSSNNIDAEKLFYEDIINTNSEYLDGYSLGDLWMMVAVAVTRNSMGAWDKNTKTVIDGPEAAKIILKSIQDCAKKGEDFSRAKYYDEFGKVVQLVSDGWEKLPDPYTTGSEIVLAYSDFKVSPLLPDSSVSGNYISISTGDLDKPTGNSAAKYRNNGVDKIDTKLNISEGGSVTLSSTVNHSNSYSYEEGISIGNEVSAIPIIQKITTTLNFKATQAVQDGWSKSEAKTQNYNTSREVDVSVPAHSVLMVKEYITDANETTRYNCPIALSYKVEFFYTPHGPYRDASGKIYSFLNEQLSPECYIEKGKNDSKRRVDAFIPDARKDLKHRALEEGKKDGYDKQGITWSEVKKLAGPQIELLSKSVPISGTGARFEAEVKAKGFKVDGAMPLYPLEKIKLMPPKISFVENTPVDITNMQYYTANMKVGDFIAPDSLQLKGYDRDGVEYCKFAQTNGSWHIVDENGLELDEETDSPVISRKIQGQERFIAVRPGACYAVYKIDEENAKYNSFENENVYVKNEDLKSTAALKLVVGITDYFEITGSYNGKVGAEADAIDANGKLSVKLRDFTGKEIDDYTYKWEALDNSGIILTEDGDVTFTRPGTYKVRVFKEYMGGQKLYSDPVEITATEDGSDPDSPYRFTITGSYKGQTGANPESIEGEGKLSVEVRDSNDNEVEYKWKSVELEKKGIKLEDDGMVSFTKAGTFHVRVYVESGGETYYSAPVEITVAEPLAVTAPKALELTYDGKEKELVIAGSIEGEGNSMVYALGDTEGTAPSSSEYRSDIPKKVNAGDYNVWYKCRDKGGAEITDAKCINVTISKAEYGRQTELNVSHNIYEADEENVIELDSFLPEDKTGLSYGDPVADGLDYDVKPSINNNVLKYGLKKSDTGGSGKITIPVSLDNYKDYNIIINITRAAPFVKEPVSSIALNYKSYNIGKGESITLTATVLPMTAEQKLVWTTDNKNVSIVPSPDTLMAYVTGKNAGSAKVTATAADGSKKKAVCSFKVGNPVGDFTILGKKGATDLAVG
ncbi:MAG: Ig-like domain-containing protein, partial [Lachnospiraceae bacterium]|nr:Ig-like domain-containing protein [Lachnospiraceae bacterium]